MFIKALKDFAQKHKSTETTSDDELTDEDAVFLVEKLSEVIDACADLEIKAAKKAMAALKEKGWSYELKESIDDLSSELLRGDYKKVTSGARWIIQLIE